MSVDMRVNIAGVEFKNPIYCTCKSLIIRMYIKHTLIKQ